ncbi:hypothetical protein B0H13DRAFT_2313307 [Mycena leptocephala]|nr:hypothetical protein B0H13DRAFT_2313307 [Mycena leptocephala]
MSWVRFGCPLCTLLGLRTFALVQPRRSGHTRVPGVASVTAFDQLVAYNTTFFTRREVVQVPLRTGDSVLRMQVAQLAADWMTGMRSCIAWGFSPVLVYTNGADHSVLRNASVWLIISNGRITSLQDCSSGASFSARPRDGASDGLVIFEDRPNYWDAWNVEIHHLEKATQLEFARVSVVAHGSLRASVCAGWSMAEQDQCYSIISDCLVGQTS